MKFIGLDAYKDSIIC